MEGYVSAVRKMEQTVMFPSLLLGVSLEDHQNNSSEKETGERDLYDYFTLLKSIKSAAEAGLAPLGSQKSHLREDESEGKADLEGLFHYHVSGLCHVLMQLTRTANTVTSKYNEIMGQINHSDVSLRW